MDKNKKIMIFTFVNIIMFIILYNIPIEMANNLCVFKLVLHKECWNCGMTRAFLSLLHFNFYEAINYNKNATTPIATAIIRTVLKNAPINPASFIASHLLSFNTSLSR